MPEGLPIAKGNQDHLLLPRMVNRHGLIAGATGTGKTVTFAPGTIAPLGSLTTPEMLPVSI